MGPLKELRIYPGRIRFIDDVDLTLGGYGEVLRGILDEKESASPKRVAIKRFRPVGGTTERTRVAVVRDFADRLVGHLLTFDFLSGWRET